MNTKILMTASAIVLALFGVVTLFAPQELLTYLGVTPAGFLPSLVQLCGALLFGFAMTNWATKGSKVGGIYNRPVAIGNLVHFAVGAITLDRFALSGHVPVVVITIAVIYTLFALAFGVVVFGRT